MRRVLRFQINLKNHRPSDREIVADLRRVARGCGRRAFSYAAYRERGRFGANTVARRFGSWNAALAAARLPVRIDRDVGDRALGDGAALADDDEVVGEPLGLLERVRRHDDGRAVVAQTADEVVDVEPGVRVQPRRGLVEEDDLRPSDEGRRDGTIRVTNPAATAAIVLAMFVASGDTTSRLFLDRLEGRIAFDDVTAAIGAFDEAIERILGLPAGSFRLMSDDLLRFWFG